ncbi:MAG: hypothetical protein ACXAEU_03395, partial [Candidatus Hodarchaeales archaeon]
MPVCTNCGTYFSDLPCPVCLEKEREQSRIDDVQQKIDQITREFRETEEKGNKEVLGLKTKLEEVEKSISLLKKQVTEITSKKEEAINRRKAAEEKI